MPRVQNQQYTFSGGEWAPEMVGRRDLARSSTACRLVQNFITIAQGPATRRPGTIFVAQTKDNSDATLIDFTFSKEQAYALEFGDQYFRVFRDRQQVMNGPDPVEIVTPYAAADLDEINWTQSADILYLFHPSYRPRKVKRTSDTDWTVEEMQFEGGPFLPENVRDEIKLVPSDVTGDITLKAEGGDVFRPAHVGSIWKLRAVELAGIPAWNSGQSAAARVINDSVIYTGAAGTAGNRAPVHTEGIRSDGKIDWTFESGIFGIVQITGFTSATEVAATVLETLPLPIKEGESNEGTNRWSEGAWSDDRGWPAVAVFHEERLWTGRTNFEPQTIWSTVIGGFGPDKELFNANEKNNDVVADNAIVRTLSDDEVNPIAWMVSADPMRIGTQGGEWTLQASNLGEAVEPTNVTAVKATSAGSAETRPVKIDQAVYFVQRTGKRLHEMAFNIADDRFASPDMTQLARHLLRAGIKRIVYQKQPWSLIWALSKCGQLRALTLLRDQDVIGWQRHVIAGASCSVRSIASTPEPEQDDVWVVVERTINGVTRRYVEVMSSEFVPSDPQDKDGAIFLDSAIQYSGGFETQFAGADHLAGQSVGVWADGALQPDTTVAADGSFTIQTAAQTVTIGLDYAPDSAIESLPIEPNNQGGSAMGMPKAAHKLASRFVDTLVARIGRGNNTEEYGFRSQGDPVNKSAPLKTGLHTSDGPFGFSRDDSVVRYEPKGGAPMTIATFSVQVSSNAG